VLQLHIHILCQRQHHAPQRTIIQAIARQAERGQAGGIIQDVWQHCRQLCAWCNVICYQLLQRQEERTQHSGRRHHPGHCLLG
jgi:hypothetical protein